MIQKKELENQLTSEQQLPTIHVDWDRFENDPATNLKAALEKPTCWAVCGRIGKGKSALVETIGCKYPKVIDIFGARDNESLSWCRSDRSDSILFLKGIGVEVKSKWDCENILDVTIDQMENYKVVVCCPAFYSSVKEEFYSLGLFMEKFYKRIHYNPKDVWCVIVREAANLLSSRLCLGERQTEAKAMMVYMLRQMRHHGIALALDSIRWKAVDIDIRDLSMYTFMKGQGIKGLPDDLKFLYNWYDPFGIMRMGVEKFVIMSEDGPIGHGTATMPYWHKQEGEDLLRLFDIEVKYPDTPEQIDNGQRHMNPYEHAQIVQARYEKHLSYAKLGLEFTRSSKTIKDVIDRHNRLIESMGQCTVCTSTKSLLNKTYIQTDRADTLEPVVKEDRQANA
jgi:hypothetical protein